MRRLSDEERVDIFGCSTIKCTIKELADRHVGTQQINSSVVPACMGYGIKEEDKNECFVEIAKKYPDRKIFGWYNKEEKVMNGTIYIQCNQNEAIEIVTLAENGGGSLSDCGPAKNGLDGFFKFKIG